MADRELLTWELFGTASRELAQTIADDGFEPTLLLTIAAAGYCRPEPSAMRST